MNNYTITMFARLLSLAPTSWGLPWSFPSKGINLANGCSHRSFKICFQSGVLSENDSYAGMSNHTGGRRGLAAHAPYIFIRN